jgi:hypothetical protein
MSFAWNDLVTVVNRTSKPLSVRADGATIVLEPHIETRVPRFVAELACRQHPQLGTEDPLNPRDFTMLVGVKEWNLPTDPIEQSTAVERLDRSSMLDVAAREATVVRGREHKPARMGSALAVDDVVFKRD